VTTDLAAWLLADDGPIAAREAEVCALLRIAQETSLELKEPNLLGRHMPGWHSWPDVEQLCQDMLAECAAKRAIVELHRPSRRVVEVGHEANWVDACPTCDEPAPCETLRLIGSLHVGREGWRDEWDVTGVS
jgi:hypothetical protein